MTATHENKQRWQSTRCDSECQLEILSKQIQELKSELAAFNIAESEKKPGGYRVVPGFLYDDTKARAEKLEAELAKERKAAEYGRMRLGPNLRKMVDDQQVRAEKAEEALKVYQDAEPIWRARAEKAEARVAELETHANRFCECGLGLEHDTPSSWKYPGPWNGGVDSRPEAREREAD